MEKDIFEQWCLVEIMGHQRLAGMVTEREIAGRGFLQVDVPECGEYPGFTKFVSPQAIHSLNPVSKEVALALVANLRARPVQTYEVELGTRLLGDGRL